MRRASFSHLLPLVVASAAACYMGSAGSHAGNGPGDDAGADASDDGGGTGPLPFAPDPPSVYVAKVKNILVGLPPSDQEVLAVEADPTQLGPLVDGWMKLPQYSTKMLRFFELAFQQTQITPFDFGNMLDMGQLQVSGPFGNIILQSLQESFARTMLDLSAAGQPFTQAMSTQTYALTTALKVFYALTDVWQIGDTLDSLTDAFQKANPSLKIYVSGKQQYMLSETLDSSNANYMHWYVPGLSCPSDPVSFPARANDLYDVLIGVFPGAHFAGCTNQGQGVLTPADFGDWTMVDIEQPSGGGKTTDFFDLQTLRGGTKLVLNRPYVGFFTTPAFFANWQTNQSNQMRVTMNQTFIVATGAQVDGTDLTKPATTPGLDTVHATAVCVSCHQTLDPSRSIFASTFSWNYGGTQTDSNFAGQPGLFAFQGVQASVKNMSDLGNTLAAHPLVASGWAEKLCYYVDSEACVPSDPAFQSIVTLFQQSSFSFDQLVKAVVTSDITTHAKTTTTATTNGETVAVSRRDHLCASWNARLGFADFCGLDVTQKVLAGKAALNIVGGLPSDGYGRGSVAPVLPNDPTMFFRGASENLCEAIAQLVVDNPNPPPNVKSWSSAQPDGAITDFVNIVMGLPPSDPRASQATSLLQAHFTLAKQQANTTATSALMSTFTAACMAPSAVSIGM